MLALDCILNFRKVLDEHLKYISAAAVLYFKVLPFSNDNG